MPGMKRANGTSQASIFARLWETENGELPQDLARHLVKLGFSEHDLARMHELREKNQQGQISPDELQELDNYVQVSDLLALLQSKARRTLQKKADTARHG